MSYLFSIIVGVLFGLIPVSSLLARVKKEQAADSGSGNVNEPDSVKEGESKANSIVIFALSFVKGLAAVFLVKEIFGDEIWNLILTAAFVVILDCFPVLPRSKGTNGIGTAAGSLILINPAIIVVWIFIWLVGYVFRRNIYFALATASLLTAVISFTSADIIDKYSFALTDTELLLPFFVSLLMIVIIIRNIDHIKTYFKSQSVNVRKD